MEKGVNKAVISDRIYLPYSDELLNAIRPELTYRFEERIPESSGKMRIVVNTVRNYNLIGTTAIAIPQGRIDLVPKEYLILDKRTEKPVVFPDALIPLRDEQVVIYDKVEDSCFINAKVGWGKTFVALHIAKKLGQKTLIVTHNTFLRDQWVTEIKKLFGIEPGIIGSAKFNIHDIITVGNVQTITKKALELSQEFGTIILDEAHHCPATTFTDIMAKSRARYRIGLSGTINRIDGKQIFFRDIFGSDLLQPPKGGTVDPTVKILVPGIELPQGVTWVQKINTLLYNSEYQNFIANVAITQIDEGHSVLVVADRVEFLEKVAELIGDECCLLTGNTASKDREAIKELINSGEKRCIVGTRSIFSEGISINRLSCLVLGTVIANEISLEQLTGRIMRQHPEKHNEPVIIDINFSGRGDKKYNDLRLGFYLRQGWVVKRI